MRINDGPMTPLLVMANHELPDLPSSLVNWLRVRLSIDGGEVPAALYSQPFMARVALGINKTVPTKLHNT
jgi:hypothetical protein